MEHWDEAKIWAQKDGWYISLSTNKEYYSLGENVYLERASGWDITYTLDATYIQERASG